MKKIIFSLALLIGLASCMDDKVYEGPPIIGDITLDNTGAITPDDAVTVTAKITALDGVSGAELLYKVNEESLKTLPMTNKEELFSAVIPKQADKAKVTFQIKATSNAKKVATSDEQSYTVGAEPIEYENLVLNEINGNDKFIEIYNKGKTTIPLEGVYLEKDESLVWTGIKGYELKSKEYLVLYTDREKPNMPEWDENLFFEGGLSAKKNVRVQLFSPAASLDDFNLTGYTTAASASYSRVPNGKGPWVFADATPGEKNETGGDPVEGLE